MTTVHLSDDDIFALDFARRALQAIAERSELVGDVIEPLNDIRTASRRAAYALKRLKQVMQKIDAA